MAARQVWREGFLKALSVSGNVRAACEAAKVNKATVYRWRERSQPFAAAWDSAIDDSIERLEQEAYRRAVTGGSDVLMIFLLKANRPEKYRENHHIELTARNAAGAEIDLVQRIIGDPEASDAAHAALRALNRPDGDARGAGDGAQRSGPGEVDASGPPAAPLEEANGRGGGAV